MAQSIQKPYFHSLTALSPIFRRRTHQPLILQPLPLPMTLAHLVHLSLMSFLLWALPQQPQLHLSPKHQKWLGRSQWSRDKADFEVNAWAFEGQIRYRKLCICQRPLPYFTIPCHSTVPCLGLGHYNTTTFTLYLFPFE